MCLLIRQRMPYHGPNSTARLGSTVTLWAKRYERDERHACMSFSPIVATTLSGNGQPGGAVHW
jgi:hypothetical protein